MSEQHDPGPRPELAWLPIDRLDVDAMYQRTIDSHKSQRHIQRLTDNFVWRKFVVVVVKPKDGGRWEIIDGQHRVEAAKRCGEPLVPAVVIAGIDQVEAAEIFAAANRDRLPLSRQAIFKGEVLAGRPEAVTLKRLCDEAGLELLTYPMAVKQTPRGKTAAIPALLNALRQGEQYLASALRSLMFAWGSRDGAMHGAFFQAATRFLAQGGDEKTLTLTLSKIGPERWAKTSPLGLGGSGPIPYLVEGLRQIIRQEGIGQSVSTPTNSAPRPAIAPAAPALKPASVDQAEIDRFIAERGVTLVQSPEQLAAYLREKGIAAVIREGELLNKAGKRGPARPFVDGRQVSFAKLYQIANDERAADGLRPLKGAA